jgi:DNA-directed RNA polymerase subunit H (RpoH/RPB5)
MNIMRHELVPKHSKVSEAEKEKLFSKYNISVRELPKILKDDPAIVNLGVAVGDIVKVERDSQTMGKSYYYRVVLDG